MTPGLEPMTRLKKCQSRVCDHDHSDTLPIRKPNFFKKNFYWGCVDWCFTIADLVHSLGALTMRNRTKEFNIAQSIEAKQVLMGSFTCRIIILHELCQFSES
ncbi:hypothetical protein TNCV_3909461 [Trichonephila clavipes]|nr:hypothetical protein TNCV_3909461 [Trichonephila clavipes]